MTNIWWIIGNLAKFIPYGRWYALCFQKLMLNITLCTPQFVYYGIIIPYQTIIFLGSCLINDNTKRSTICSLKYICFYLPTVNTSIFWNLSCKISSKNYFPFHNCQHVMIKNKLFSVSFYLFLILIIIITNFAVAI